MFKSFRSTFRAQRSRQRFEESMSDELRFHIEQLTADLVAPECRSKKRNDKPEWNWAA